MFIPPEVLAAMKNMAQSQGQTPQTQEMQATPSDSSPVTPSSPMSIPDASGQKYAETEDTSGEKVKVPELIASASGSPLEATPQSADGKSATWGDSIPYDDIDPKKDEEAIKPPSVKVDANGVPQFPADVVSEGGEEPAHLAPQKGNGFWSMLGAHPETPAPNQLFTGKTSLADKVKAGVRTGVNILGPLSAGIAAASSSPENRDHTAAELQLKEHENARNYGIQQQELQIQKQNAANEAKRWQAYADYTSGRNATSENVAGIRSAPAMARVQAMQEVNSARAEMMRAQAVYERSRADYNMNPDNPRLKQQHELAMAQLAMAGKRLDMGLSHLAIAEHDMELKDQTFRNTWAQDPTTGAPVSPEAMPAGTMLDENGNAVGTRNAANVRPTTTARAKGEQTKVIEQSTQELENYVKANANLLGPLLGRYGSLTSFVSGSDPRFAKLRSMVTTWAALQPAAHGFRGIDAVREFEHSLNFPVNSAPAMIQAMEGTKLMLHPMFVEGTPKVNTPRKPNSATPPATPPANGGGNGGVNFSHVSSDGKWGYDQTLQKWVPNPTYKGAK